MRYFEKVSYLDDVEIPKRSTDNSAGYDFYAYEDILIPSIPKMLLSFMELDKSLDNSVNEIMDTASVTEDWWNRINDLTQKINDEVNWNTPDPGQPFIPHPIKDKKLLDMQDELTQEVLALNNIDYNFTLDKFAERFKPILVSTGVKAFMQLDEALLLLNRSGNPKKGLVVANGVGLIDSDYYNNEDNEGLIFVPFLNYTTKDVEIKKGDRIAQGVFTKFLITNDDKLYKKNNRSRGFGSTGN